MNKIYQQHWMDLPREVRLLLVNIFNIVKTGVCEVKDNKVLTDGYTNQDLEAITLDKLVDFTKVPATEGFPRLWEITLKLVERQLHPNMNIPTSIKIETIEIKDDKPLKEVIAEAIDKQKVDLKEAVKIVKRKYVRKNK